MKPKAGYIVAIAIFVPLLIASNFFNVEERPTHVFRHLTEPVIVEDIYPSMFGPTEERLDLQLHDGSPELVWVTGYRAEMVDPSGEQQSQEFMCHDTLSFHDPTARSRVFGSVQSRQGRLFTLSQGQGDIRLPSGFGIPMGANENLMLQSQVLNLREQAIGSVVSHRIDTEYIPDRETDGTMKALTMVDGGISVDVLDPQAEEPPADVLSCAPDAGGQPTFNHRGKEVTAHWVVKPGYERRETELGRMFPIDTTAHYISVHMHNYGVSLELYDETAEKTVFKSVCTPTSDGKGLARTTTFSSEEGIEVFRNHKYKVISEYNNTSDQDQTAMAFVFVYIYNPFFEKPDPKDFLKLQPNDEFCTVEETP